MEHLNRLRILNYVMAAVEGLGLVALVATMGLVGATQPLGANELWIIVGVTGGAALLLLGLIAGFMVAAGRVARGQGKVLETVLAVLTLGNFPGGLFGVYALWVMWYNPETKAIFADGGIEA